MTPTSLRYTILLAVMLGAGVIANVFTDGGSGSGASEKAAGEGAARTIAGRDKAEPAVASGTLKAVRRELLARRYLAGAIEGGIDPVTRGAILAFEFDYNIALTGEPSADVLKSLLFLMVPVAKTTTARPVGRGAQQFIARVQQALSKLGYGGQGAVSGALDETTRRAIAAFERARGLEVSGRISAPLIKSLGPALVESDKNALKPAASRVAG